MVEQLKHFFDWYLGLFSDSDNKVKIAVWTATLATITFVISFILKPSRQYILNKLGNRKKESEEKKKSIPEFEIKIDAEGHFLQINDKNFNSKIVLAKQIFRSQKGKGLKIKVIPNFSTKKLDDNYKRTLVIRLQDLATELEKKLEILLSKTIEQILENPENILTVLNSLVEKQNPNFTGKTKIELYRTHEPKINFPIYLNNAEMKSLANNSNKTVDELINLLRLPAMITTSVFTDEILLRQVIPGLVREIYRISSRHNFDISKPHWENIHSYEVGLG